MTLLFQLAPVTDLLCCFINNSFYRAASAFFSLYRCHTRSFFRGFRVSLAEWLVFLVDLSEYFDPKMLDDALGFEAGGVIIDKV